MVRQPIASNGNGNLHPKRTSDTTIYEQFQSQGQNSNHSNGFLANNIDDSPQKSLLPPFESAEMRTLAESLSRDIIRGSPDVKWESIKGLETAKRLLKEAVVMQSSIPNTLLAYYHLGKGFFCLGHQGQERQCLQRPLQQSARLHFLIFLHPLLSANGEIIVPLPEPEARKATGEQHMPHDLLVEQTEGYSGSDIRLLCKEAAIQPLRRLMSQLERREEVVPEEELPKVGSIGPKDIEIAFKNTRPSAHLHAHK